MIYSACVSALFGARPVHECLEDARRAGFEAYEFWSWWDQDLEAIARAQRETGLRPVALCTRFIPLNRPEEREAYLSGLEETLAAAKKLGCPAVITQVGQDLPGVSREEQHESIVGGLRACAPRLEAAGVTLLVEPLNDKIDHPGYYLTSAQEAFQMADEAGSDRVKILYDIYHQYIMEASPKEEILSALDRIGHFHLAGYPGRHEPWRESQIDCVPLLGALGEAGYTGAVGLEYFPKAGFREGLEGVKTLPYWK